MQLNLFLIKCRSSYLNATFKLYPDHNSFDNYVFDYVAFFQAIWLQITMVALTPINLYQEATENSLFILRVLPNYATKIGCSSLVCQRKNAVSQVHASFLPELFKQIVIDIYPPYLILTVSGSRDVGQIQVRPNRTVFRGNCIARVQHRRDATLPPSPNCLQKNEYYRKVLFDFN